MSTLTTNLKLNKPEGTEHYNVSIQNENMDKIDEFCGRTDNPHNVTKEQVGLSNVPNVTTNNQTPTFTVASSNKDLTSGEILSTSFGKIAKAINSLISHLANTSNPHNTTASQVGLGNVPNLATNDLTPTYTEASSNTALVSGEKLSISFGKLSKAVSSLISHLANVSNPHSVTATQVGLGNVDNVSTNNQKPTYTVASSNTALSSGETLSTALGKIAKAVNSLISHLADNVGHITSEERTKWNAKANQSAVDNIVSGSTTVGNSTKVNGYSSWQVQNVNEVNTPINNYLYSQYNTSTNTFHLKSSQSGIDTSVDQATNASTLDGSYKNDFMQAYTHMRSENGGENGSGIDLNTVTAIGLHEFSGNFSAVVNAPKGWYGDQHMLVMGRGNGNNTTQIVQIGDKLCYRKNAWNGDWDEWYYGNSSAPVRIQETAPSDTTSLWVW